MPYSLIKCGGESDERLLEEMILASIDAYKAEISCAETDPANIAGLKAFRERMINEGNPSSSVLEKVFGKEGAKEFFNRCVIAMSTMNGRSGSSCWLKPGSGKWKRKQATGYCG